MVVIKGFRSMLVALGLTVASTAAFSAQVIPVVETEARSMATIGGTVVPYKEVTLSAQLPGRIEFIAGEEGDSFNDSELLITIDDDDLQAKRSAANASLLQAESALGNAQMQYSRELYSPQSQNIGNMPGMGMPAMFDNLFTRNLGTMAGFGDKDVDRAADLYSRGSGVAQAQAGVAAARSQLEELEAKLRDTKSIAPFEGVITQKLVEVGDTVQPGQPLLKFAHTKFLRIQVEVPARLVVNLQPGMVVPAYLDIGRTKIMARVAQIYPIADAARHTVTVKFDLPTNVPGGSGMYAEVQVPDGKEIGRQVVIPTTALITGGSLPAVLRVVDGSSELRVLRLGKKMGDGNVIVLSGLKSGDQIIDNPPPGVSSGWMPGKE